MFETLSETALTWMIFGGILLMMLIVILLFMRGSEYKRRQRRLSNVRMRWSKNLETHEIESLRRKDQDEAGGILGWIVRHLPNIDKLRQRLERTGANLPVSRYLTFCFLILALCTLIIGGMFGMPWLLGGFIGIAAGLGIPHMVVGFMANLRVNRFLALFPEAIDLIVRGLRSGLPIQEGFKVVAQETADPMSTEFARIVDAIKLGVPLEKALMDAALRLRITEFDFFVTSISLQRETGGNLAEILNNLSEAVRGRLMLKLKIKAMSSEARTSAIIVGILPFGVMGAMLMLSPDYLDPLFTDFRGNIAGIGATISLLVGVWVMKKMASFEL